MDLKSVNIADVRNPGLTLCSAKSKPRILFGSKHDCFDSAKPTGKVRSSLSGGVKTGAGQADALLCDLQPWVKLQKLMVMVGVPHHGLAV